MEERREKGEGGGKEVIKEREKRGRKRGNTDDSEQREHQQ